MASWILVPCLAQLRTEFNQIAPGRDKASDGSIGDQAHSARTSDHNPDSRDLVHAIDVDRDLRAGDLTMERVVQHLIGRCRSGAEKRLKYVIYNRRIWSASSDWIQKTYTGANDHTHHAHFSANSNPAHEASTASWHLEDLVATLDADDLKNIAKAVWNHTEPNPLDPKTPGRMGGWARMAEARANARQAQLLAAITKDDVDEQALAAAIVAGILPALPAGADVSTEQLQEAIVGALRDLATPQA